MLSAYVVKHEKTFVHTSPYSYFCMIRIYRNMKRILPVVSVILTLFGCQSLGFYGSYDYAFIGVSDYNMSDTARVENHNYEDSLISINWSINNGWGFDFALTNKTNGNIEIDWRKVSFISPCGYMSRSTVDFNSFIPPAATISQRLRWAKFSPMPMASLEAYNYNIWSTYKIIEIRPTYYIEIRDAWKSMLGKQFSVYFPMKIKDKEYNYKFIFEVERLNVTQQAPDTIYSIRKGENFPKAVRTIEDIKRSFGGKIRIAPPIR